MTAIDIPDAVLVNEGPQLIERPMTDDMVKALESGEAKFGDAIFDVPVSTLSDRQLLEETVLLQRRQRDAVNELLSGVMDSPLGKMLKGGGNPLSMFGMGR